MFSNLKHQLAQFLELYQNFFTVTDLTHFRLDLMS